MRQVPFVGLALIALTTIGSPAVAPVQRVRGGSLDFPHSDPPSDIAKALQECEKDGKRVLLNFGADWCVDCKVLEQIFRDSTVAKFLDDHFHVVRIDLGAYFESDKIKNADTAAKYGVGLETGIPALVLLDVHERVVRPRDLVSWRTARSFTVPQVLDYLKQLAAAR